MAWQATARLLLPFAAMGAAAGVLFGLATGRVLFFTGMGVAAGTMMGAAWIVRVRRAE